MTAFQDDPFGGIKNDKKSPSPEPREVNLFHTRSDCDTGTFAKHHTIGIEHNQASGGDHTHDGVASRKLGTGQSLVLTGSTGGNVALQNLIDFLKNFVDFTDNTT
jgi:hypothetical protein